MARAVFLERGIQATTLEVAERAGVSEGAIFHRFKSKEGLFSAAMDFDPEAAPRRMLEAIRELEGLELRDALIHLATALLEVGRVALPILMMAWSNPGACTTPLFDRKRSKFREVLKALGGYFEQQMELGKLRRLDAEVLARTFLGAVHHFATTQIVFEAGDGSVIPEGMFVRGLADLLLHGAERTARRPPRRRTATGARRRLRKAPATAPRRS